MSAITVSRAVAARSASCSTSACSVTSTSEPTAHASAAGRSFRVTTVSDRPAVRATPTENCCRRRPSRDSQTTGETSARRNRSKQRKSSCGQRTSTAFGAAATARECSVCAGRTNTGKVTPPSLGTMRTDGPTFVVLLTGVVILLPALTILPALVVFLIFQRAYIRGILGGSVKG